MLPKRRERPRSGIERAPKREWPRHRKFVRSFTCILWAKEGHQCDSPPRFCHVRHETDGGTSIKPSDWWSYPGCDCAHEEQHRIGEPAFERKWGVNLKPVALELARFSPDFEMKTVMRELGLI